MKYARYSPLLLRTGLAVVFFWFAFSQLSNPASWTRLLPEYVLSFGISATTLIYLNATFELIFGTLLLLGLFTRVSALLLGLHLLNIVYTLGYGAIAVRDFGLAIATFSVLLAGADEFCLDEILFNKKKE